MTDLDEKIRKIDDEGCSYGDSCQYGSLLDLVAGLRSDLDEALAFADGAVETQLALAAEARDREADLRARLKEAADVASQLANDHAIMAAEARDAADLRAEVERLTRERDSNLRGVTNAMRAGGEACDDLHAEIERLRGLLVATEKRLDAVAEERDDARQGCAAIEAQNTELCARAAERRGDIERLTRERDEALSAADSEADGWRSASEAESEVGRLLATVDNLRADLAEAWRERNDARSTLAAVTAAIDEWVAAQIALDNLRAMTAAARIGEILDAAPPTGDVLGRIEVAVQDRLADVDRVVADLMRGDDDNTGGGA